MPGHNAFQRNAFQRNAFQIVYAFTPTTSGGVIVGGDVTGHFREKNTAIVTGGLIVGGNVTARFHSGVQRHGGGKPDKRIWQIIFPRRKRHFKPRASGGLLVNGAVRAEYFGQEPELLSLPEVVTSVFLATTSGGVVTGGEVSAYFRWFTSPPPDLIHFKYIPPEPVGHTPVASGGRSFGGGVRAAFKRAPALIDYRAARLRKQIEEEDELLLLGAFDE